VLIEIIFFPFNASLIESKLTVRGVRLLTHPNPVFGDIDPSETPGDRARPLYSLKNLDNYKLKERGVR